MTTKTMTPVDAREDDLPGILAIYNDAVRNTLAIWNEAEANLQNRQDWWTGRVAQGYPVLVLRDDSGVLGYASFGDWRAFEGFRHTVEHSIYIRSDARGRGLAGHLLAALIERARQIGKHVIVAGVESGNAASIRLHERAGFRITGQMPQVGCKFGRWLDLTFLQLTLDERPTPDPAP
ncbi:GNAT family N-acetyltransferase [Salipiger sp. 1_MG-2023]|uniref:GNAT family N-acetyltransferase n=1 Tax=Salipiger sp. 1_MG-2023 TaxID=3062665 RepID=UPI0026E3A16F|nr:GNAT family N-acetyltransferase [Salipiger sp. 1_MG-2023]MDO6587160.1 GNAT family N-acetyltransferase [Salipiger sp. 1_MG-2023]